MTMSGIRENLQSIRARIRKACERVGRDPSTVRLIGVSKTVDAARVREAAHAGLTDVGENYVQEAVKKIEELNALDLCWHFIGHLQTNKAKHVVSRFHWVQTVDRLKLARELDRRAAAADRRLSVLIQVRLGKETTKSGVDPEGLPNLFHEIDRMEWLDVRGLMTLPPYWDDPEKVRPYFRELRDLLEKLRDEAADPGRLTELSMGMSHDFEVAVEEGATMVRVGTALFGPRAPK